MIAIATFVSFRGIGEAGVIERLDSLRVRLREGADPRSRSNRTSPCRDRDRGQTPKHQVDLIVTELAVMQPTADGLVLRELGPGIDIATVQRLTAARLTVEGSGPFMAFQ